MVRLALTALTLLMALPAAAWHTERTPVTDYSAYTLNQWEWRVGPLRAGLGVGYGVELGIYPTMAAIGAGNLQIKWTAWNSGPWAVALRTGIFTFDTAQYVDEPAEGTKPLVFSAVPFELMGSWRAERSTLNLTVSGTLVEAEGSYQGELDGAGAFNTVALIGAWEWRWSKVTALVLEGRLKLSEQLTADAAIRRELDDDSYLEIYGNGNADIDGAKGSLSLSMFWSYEHFNLRAGLGYGHYMVPAANIFIPVAIPFPEFAMFWRY